jgi:hypothetical protein
LSPRSRHGRGSASRRSRHRHQPGGHAPQPAAQAATASEAPLEEAPESQVISEAGTAQLDDKRTRQAPVKKKKHHGALYRWVAAYMPLLGILFGLLAVLWVWVSFISPPPVEPKDRWQQIEDRWSPVREQARNDLASHGRDFVAQLADYKAFYDATKGWLDDVQAYDRWAEADETGNVAYYVSRFVADGQDFLDLLQKAYQAKTPEEILTMEETLPAADQTWETDRAVVRVELGLPAVPEPSELPLPSAACIPVGPESPGVSASPGASASAGASGSLEPTLPPCPTPTPTASESAEATASPS